MFYLLHECRVIAQASSRAAWPPSTYINMAQWLECPPTRDTIPVASAKVASLTQRLIAVLWIGAVLSSHSILTDKHEFYSDMHNSVESTSCTVTRSEQDQSGTVCSQPVLSTCEKVRNDLKQLAHLCRDS